MRIDFFTALNYLQYILQNEANRILMFMMHFVVNELLCLLVLCVYASNKSFCLVTLVMLTYLDDV